MKALDSRSLTVLLKIVDLYLDRRQPIGSKTLAQHLSWPVSAPTLRNIMAKLEAEEWLYSNHCSSGRVPSKKALKLYVQQNAFTLNLPKATADALMAAFEEHKAKTSSEHIVDTVAELCQCAGFLFVSDQGDGTIEYLDFVYLAPGKALAVLVTENQHVQHYFICIPVCLTAEALKTYHTYLNPDLKGLQIHKVFSYLQAKPLPFHLKECLNQLSALPLGTKKTSFIVKGKAQLVQRISQQHAINLETFSHLLHWLESQESFSQIFTHVNTGDATEVVWGEDNSVFQFEDFCLITSTYWNTQESSKGMIGAVGPVYMDYQRIIPIIEKTAQFMKDFCTP